MDAHGETRPRKRGHSNRKNKEARNVEVPEPEVTRDKIVEEDDLGDDSWNNYHVEEDSGASLTYKILFFVLLLVLGGLATLVLIDNNNNNAGSSVGEVDHSDDHVPIEVEEPYVASSWLDWLTNEEPDDHGIVEEHDEEGHEFVDDHDHEDDHGHDEHAHGDDDHDEEQEREKDESDQPDDASPAETNDDDNDIEGHNNIPENNQQAKERQDEDEDEEEAEEPVAASTRENFLEQDLADGDTRDRVEDEAGVGDNFDFLDDMEFGIHQEEISETPEQEDEAAESKAETPINNLEEIENIAYNDFIEDNTAQPDFAHDDIDNEDELIDEMEERAFL